MRVSLLLWDRVVAQVFTMAGCFPPMYPALGALAWWGTLRAPLWRPSSPARSCFQPSMGNEDFGQGWGREK